MCFLTEIRRYLAPLSLDLGRGSAGSPSHGCGSIPSWLVTGTWLDQYFHFIWVNSNDLTVRPSTGIMVYFREIIPKWPNNSG